jgi:hypothetical protein
MENTKTSHKIVRGEKFLMLLSLIYQGDFKKPPIISSLITTTSLFWQHVRHRIHTALTTRTTTADALECQPTTAPSAMTIDRND